MGIYKTGDQLGNLTLLSFKDNKWTVFCSLCNAEWTTRTNRLHNRKHCAACDPNPKGFHHYNIGDVIDGQTLIEKLPYKRWKMQCTCGAIRSGSPCDIKRYQTCKECHQPDEVGKRKRLPGNISLYRERLAYYRRGARERDLVWNLTEERFIELIESPCHFCGEVGSMTEKRKDRTIKVNGIDRVKNEIGYKESNVVPCCSFCNHAKKNHSYEYFVEKIKYIANYLSSETIPSGSTNKCLET